MKNLYLIVGGAIIVGSLILLKKKKVEKEKIQQKQKEEDLKVVQDKLQQDFDTAVQTQAEAMNIDLINENKAKALVFIYDGIWKSIFKMGVVTGNNKNLIAYKNQLKDIEKQINDLGFVLHSSPRSVSGSFVTKK